MIRLRSSDRRFTSACPEEISRVISVRDSRVAGLGAGTVGGMTGPYRGGVKDTQGTRLDVARPPGVREVSGGRPRVALSEGAAPGQGQGRTRSGPPEEISGGPLVGW